MKRKIIFALCVTLSLAITTAWSQGIIYVNVSSPAGAGGNGTTWATAYNDLQTALTNATADNQIWVAKGTYYPSQIPVSATGTLTDRHKTFQLMPNVSIYGGFEGTEENLSERNWKDNITILSGDIGTAGSTGDNCHHVVSAIGEVGNARLDGFTITDGVANMTGTISVNSLSINNNYGGGMVIYDAGAGLTLTNLIVTNNVATSRGGGIYTDLSAIVNGNNITITNNTANLGGGIYSGGDSKCNLTHSTVSNNTTNGHGAGIYLAGSSPELTDVTIRGNSITENNSGGGMYITNNSAPLLTRVTISKNITQFSGGGVFCSGAQPVFTHVTVDSNIAASGEIGRAHV